MIADENGEPYSVHHRDIAYEAVVYPNEDNTGYVFEKHEDAFDNFEKEYYIQIKNTGQPYVMDPYVYELMGKNIMMISIIAPILDADGNFLGVTGVDVGLDNMQEKLLVSTDYKSAHLTALSADGTILMDSADAGKVGMNAKDAGYDKLMEDAEKVYGMQAGEFENSRYLIDKGENFGTGKSGITVTIPMTVRGKTQWTMHLSIDSTEFYWAIIEGAGLLTIVVVIFGFLLLYALKRIIKGHLAPIQVITDKAAKLEAGDLNIHIDISSDDELGRLSQAFNNISTTMNNYVKDISEQLSKMADNHMDITITQDYIGDFIPIQASIEKISQSLNDTMHEIVISADEVSTSSETVFSDAQALSDGASEQAAAIDELAAAIDSLSRDVAANASDAETANAAVTEVGNNIAESNKEMGRLTDAMEKISSASQNQKAVLEKLTEHVDSISSVVQSNSDSAKGSADTSAELSASSKRLHELVSKFHLKQR